MFASPSQKQEVRRTYALVRHILSQVWTVQLANLSCAIVYVLTCWDSVDHSKLTVWFIGVVTLSASRGIYHVRTLRKGDAYIKSHASSILRVLYISILLSGTVWGAIGSALLHSSQPYAVMISIFILAGLSAGGVASYAVSPWLLYGFLSLTIMPLAIRLALDQTKENMVLSGLSVLYLVLLGGSARNVYRHNQENINLSLANQDLIRHLNDASHEVRTPVSAIIGFAEVLRDRKEMPVSLNDYVDIIYRNSVYLAKLVDNLFLMAKAEAGELSENEETFNIVDHVQLAIELVRKKAEGKGLKVYAEFSPQLLPFVTSYPIKLQQILINLLSNAVKFTEQGEVRAVVERGSDQSLRIVVSDTGIGVRDEVQDLIFEPFWRENRYEVKREEGSGLGLALSHHLVAQMGGELALKSSKLGQGSQFELIVPVKWSESLHAVNVLSTMSARLSGKKVLLADDSPDLRALFTYRFEQAGAKVDAVEDGAQAVAKISVSIMDCPDVVILDINMPVMDGYCAAAEMRKRGVKVPILALSANVDCPEEDKKCRVAGFNAQLKKTAAVNEIVEKVAAYL